MSDARSGPDFEEPSSTKYRLTVIAGHDEGRTMVLPDGQATRIGSNEEADLTLNDAGVSRNHCLIQVLKGRAMLIDTRSEGGTMVNGDTVEEQQLRVGDTIQMGATIMRFQFAEDRAESGGGLTRRPRNPAPVPINPGSPGSNLPPIVVNVGTEEPDELVRERIEDLRERRAGRKEDRHHSRQDREANTAGIAGFAMAVTVTLITLRAYLFQDEGERFYRGALGCLGFPVTIAALVCSIVGWARPGRNRILAIIGVVLSAALLLFFLPNLFEKMV